MSPEEQKREHEESEASPVRVKDGRTLRVLEALREYGKRKDARRPERRGAPRR